MMIFIFGNPGINMCILCTEIIKNKMNRTEIGKACLELLSAKEDEHIEELLQKTLYEMSIEELIDWYMSK